LHYLRRRRESAPARLKGSGNGPMYKDMLKPVGPMTAAERQRKCRAGGKGRHRGGSTGKQMAEARRRVAAWQRAIAAGEDIELAAARILGIKAQPVVATEPPAVASEPPAQGGANSLAA